MTKRNILNALPEIEALRKLSQSLAMLDAILSPEWEYRYYSFDSKWSADEMMASMRNGSDDGYFILFNQYGAIIKGFAHESLMSPWGSESEEVWLGVLDEVPSEFQSFLQEPAFSITDATFCIWRRSGDGTWKIGEIDYPEGENDPDVSDQILSILNGDPTAYQGFAESYYERKIPLSAIKHIYEHNSLTGKIVRLLNQDISIGELQRDIEEIGYPRSAT